MTNFLSLSPQQYNSTIKGHTKGHIKGHTSGIERQVKGHAKGHHLKQANARQQWSPSWILDFEPGMLRL